MKLKIIIALLLLIAAFIFIYAYTHPGSESEIVDDKIGVEEDLNQNSSDGQVRITEESLEFSDVTQNYEINGKRPTTDMAGNEAVDNFIDLYIEDFKQFADESVPSLREEGSAVSKYLLNVEHEYFENNEFAFHLVYFGEYTGGANTNSIVHSLVFEKDSEKRVLLSDYISDEKKDDFVVAVRERLIDMDEERGGSLFVNVIKNLEFGDMNAFYVQDDLITVLFSKYEVAPGVEGIVRVEVNNIYR